MDFKHKEAVAIWFQEYCTGESSTYIVHKLDKPDKDGYDIEITHEDTGEITSIRAKEFIDYHEAEQNDL